MTGIETVTEFIRSWTPWFAVLGLLYRGWRGAKKNVTDWANTLLDNHAAHAQASLDRIEETQVQQLALIETSNQILTRIAEK